jgi:hypothetical protein
VKLALVVLAVAAAAAGCPKDRSPARAEPRDGPAPAPDPAPAEPPFTAAPTPIVTAELAPATFDWARPTMTQAELEDALDDGDPDDVAEVRARGRIVVTLQDAFLEEVDPATGKTPYRGAGLLGLDIDPPVTFTAEPSLQRGSMPMGGHVRLHTGYLRGTLDLDAAGRDALREQLAGDGLVTQYLVELGDLAPAVDDSGEQVTVLHATLHGVRVVQLRARRTFVEGRPATPLRP